MQIGRVEVSPSISCSGASRKKNARLTEKALNKKHIFLSYGSFMYSQKYSDIHLLIFFVPLILIIQSILTILQILPNGMIH